jgi:hypothetical protein
MVATDLLEAEEFEQAQPQDDMDEGPSVGELTHLVDPLVIDGDPVDQSADHPDKQPSRRGRRPYTCDYSRVFPACRHVRLPLTSIYHRGTRPFYYHPVA